MTSLTMRNVGLVRFDLRLKSWWFSTLAGRSRADVPPLRLPLLTGAGANGIAKRGQTAHRDASDQLDLVHDSRQTGVPIVHRGFSQCLFLSVSCVVVVYGTFDIGELVDRVSYIEPGPVESHDPPSKELVSRGVIRGIRQVAVRVERVFDRPEHGVVFVKHLLIRRDGADAKPQVHTVYAVNLVRQTCSV